ncbi:translation initiation factor IF-2 subunit gamma [Candidatus Woesearchaeota archaeon]|nr:translation initiation factor IF-2 subunit gamma [Candidatus Woesearchaeota archaeon]
MVKKNELVPEISIGLVGHVDHGKTTLVKALSGVWTDTHSEEIKRGITIRLGYADAVFYKCEKCKKHSVKEKCDCKGKGKPLRKVSFVDAPGHESLMATMLSGATIMDGALLLIAANESCPQPQTREHLMALEISGIKNIVIVQNKIDIISEKEAIKNYKEIKEFIKGTSYENAPIIPISAQQNVNIDVLIEAIEKNLKTPKRDPDTDPIMFIARSFDINRPGSDYEKLVGGVLGGALKQGLLKLNQDIEIKPGIVIEEKGRKEYKEIITKIIGLKSGNLTVKEVGPGGTIGVLTSLDPAIVKSDSLAGNIVGLPGKLPPVWNDLKLETHLLERVVGVEEELGVEPIKINEILMLNINSAATVGVVVELKKDFIRCKLKLPVCANPNSNVTISRRIGNRFRLIGYSIITQ